MERKRHRDTETSQASGIQGECTRVLDAPRPEDPANLCGPAQAWGNRGPGWEVPIARAYRTARSASAADTHAQHTEQTVTGGSMTARVPTLCAQRLTPRRQREKHRFLSF